MASSSIFFKRAPSPRRHLWLERDILDWLPPSHWRPSLAVGLRPCLPLHAHRDDLRAVAASFHVHDTGSLDEVGEAGKTVVARIKVRRLFRQMGADARQVGTAVFIGRRRHGILKHLQRGSVKLRFCRCLGWGCLGLLDFRYSSRLRIVARRLGLYRIGVEHVEIDELVASGNEGARGFAFAEAVDGDALFADTRRQPGEIAIAGNDAKCGKTAGVEQVHRVNDHCPVRGILSRRVGKLLDRLDGMLQQALFPAVKVGLGPVPIDALDAGGAIGGDLGQETTDDFRRGIVAVYEESQRVGCAGHLLCLLLQAPFLP